MSHTLSNSLTQGQFPSSALGGIHEENHNEENPLDKAADRAVDAYTTLVGRISDVVYNLNYFDLQGDELERRLKFLKETTEILNTLPCAEKIEKELNARVQKSIDEIDTADVVNS